MSQESSGLSPAEYRKYHPKSKEEAQKRRLGAKVVAVVMTGLTAIGAINMAPKVAEGAKWVAKPPLELIKGDSVELDRDELVPYTVKHGDVLEDIAKAEVGEDADLRPMKHELAEVNGLEDPNKLQVGQELLITEKAAKELQEKHGGTG